MYVRTYVQILSSLDYLALAMTIGELQSERTLGTEFGYLGMDMRLHLRERFSVIVFCILIEQL